MSGIQPFAPARRQRGQASLALTVLVLFVGGIVLAAVGEPTHPETSAGRPSSIEVTSCPDTGDDGIPCAPSCRCNCCPGHWTAAESSAIRPNAYAPRLDEFAASLPDDLRPKDVHQRIFHPPRA